MIYAPLLIKLTCQKDGANLHTVKQYRQHALANKICHASYPFGCHFCVNIVFETSRLNQCLKKNNICTFVDEHLKVTTELLVDICNPVKNNTKKENMSLYTN